MNKDWFKNKYAKEFLETKKFEILDENLMNKDWFKNKYAKEFLETKKFEILDENLMDEVDILIEDVGNYLNNEDRISLLENKIKTIESTLDDLLNARKEELKASSVLEQYKAIQAPVKTFFMATSPSVDDIRPKYYQGIPIYYHNQDFMFNDWIGYRVKITTMYTNNPIKIFQTSAKDEESAIIYAQIHMGTRSDLCKYEVI